MWFQFLSVMCLLPLASSSAAEPVKLNCPAGTKQTSSANGKAHDIVACVRADGKGYGPMVYLYPSGVKQGEGMAEDGFRTGNWTFYNEQGRKTGTATFKRSNYHGDVVELHENGKVKRVDHYVEGLREGTTQEYSDAGELLKQTEYRNNREVVVK